MKLQKVKKYKQLKTVQKLSELYLVTFFHWYYTFFMKMYIASKCTLLVSIIANNRYWHWKKTCKSIPGDRVSQSHIKIYKLLTKASLISCQLPFLKTLYVRICHLSNSYSKQIVGSITPENWVPTPMMRNKEIYSPSIIGQQQLLAVYRLYIIGYHYIANVSSCLERSAFQQKFTESSKANFNLFFPPFQ